MFRRRRDGEVVDPRSSSSRSLHCYRYDVLRALEYFGNAGRSFDPRMAEAHALIDSKRGADGRWRLERTHQEPLPVRLRETLGQPSRWNTLRALRVLRSLSSDIGLRETSLAGG
jgi:hypothetical protein